MSPVRPVALVLSTLLAVCVAGCSAQGPDEAVPTPGAGASAPAGDEGAGGTVTPSPTSSSAGPDTPAPTAPDAMPAPEGTAAPEDSLAEAPAAASTPVATRTLPPVEVGREAGFEGGLAVTVIDVVDVDLEARGPGQVAGDGLAVDLEVQNGSGDPVDLSGMAVSATYGDGVPAPPSSSPPSLAMSGALEPGAEATGVYVFAAPAGTALRIQVEHNQHRDVVVVQQ